ncbi:MFS transporter [Microbacterium sp. 18062]|uniref:MFS transporter n=1 Tax=Microbacterium sp. 18062 TaxID=2681410 RepID=UPI00135C866C|nr:MFS transporter [Microbacterium sp. 18062]
MASRTDDRTLVQHTGWGYFPIAFVARLPFAMMVVGVLTLVTSATASVALGGLASAAVGIGVVVAGPVIGDAVDRHGQRTVLVPVGLLNGVLLALFPLVVLSGMPAGMVLVVAALIGVTAPQAAAMSRSRVIAIIRDRLRPERRPRTFSRAMSYESAADETAFVIGPFLVGVFASLLAPWAPIAIAAALSFVFVTAFALHPTGVLATSSESETEQRAPFSAVLHPRVLVLVGATFAVGLFFGATLTSLTAFMETRGEGSEAGLLYGLMGIGSAILALAVAALPPRFALRWRWIVFAAVMTVSASAYAMTHAVDGLVVTLLVMGLGVGPALVTIFSLAGERSPAGRSATTMTLLASALTLAQALASAVTGAVGENVSVTLALAFPAVAGLLVVLFGVLNLAVERREHRRAYSVGYASNTVSAGSGS